MHRLLVALLFGLLASGNASAHRDAILPIQPDGTMHNLPSKFGPAKLQVSFSTAIAGRPPVTSVVLQLRGNQIKLPTCITSLLRSTSLKEVLAVGSWYHDEATLPYYLDLTFFDPGYTRKKWANSGVKMLFNLRTGKLMEIRTLVVGDEGRSVQRVDVDIKSRCTLEEQASLKLESAIGHRNLESGTAEK